MNGIITFVGTIVVLALLIRGAIGFYQDMKKKDNNKPRY